MSMSTRVTDGIDANNTSPDQQHRTIEVACVDLIAQLEFLLAHAKDQCRSDQVVRSPETANKMMARLLEFTEQHLHGNAADQARDRLVKVAEVSAMHKSVIEGRSWTESLRSIFMSDGVDYNSLTTHAALGKAVARAAASVFYGTINMFNQDTESGKELCQSATTFLQQLESQW